MRYARQVGLIKSRTQQTPVALPPNTASSSSSSSITPHTDASKASLVYVPSRERAIFSKVIQLNDAVDGPLTNVAACAIWREIMSASISLQRRTVVAVSGCQGSFGHHAAILRFGASVDYICCEGDERGNSVNEVWSAVTNGRAQYGVGNNMHTHIHTRPPSIIHFRVICAASPLTSNAHAHTVVVAHAFTHV